MKNNSDIKELLKDKLELQSKLAFNHSYEEVEQILALKKMSDPKFAQVFKSNIWKTYYKNIKLILEMEEWNNPKYQHLLTSSIWNRSYSEVKNTLNMKEWNAPKYERLLTPSIWQCSYNDIKDILAMKEWDDPKFSHLLTPSVWCSRSHQIKEKFNIPYFQMPEYQHLLTPGIFLITNNNIISNIELFQSLGLERFLSATNIRIDVESQKLLIKYMVNNNIPLVVRGRLHDILRSPVDSKLKEYGISWDIVKGNLKEKEKTI